MYEEIKYKKDYELLILELKKNCKSHEQLQIEQLYRFFKPKVYNKKTFYTKEGEIEQKLSFICKGLFKYYYIDANGKQKIKTFTSEGSFLSSYAALIYQFPSYYFIEALEDSRVLQIKSKDYQHFINHSNLWSNIARRYTEKIYLEKEKREASFLKEDAFLRYQNFLKEYSNIVHRLQLKDIASYLGISPVSLSRLRAQNRD